MRGSAPGERRGGRKAGTPNRKTALLRDALADDGIDPARSLVKIARAAEQKDDLALAAECWGKLVHFIYPKPRPIVIDPDALVELEERIAGARADALARKGWNPADGWGDRMVRLGLSLDEEERQARERMRSQILAEIGSGSAQAPAAETVNVDRAPEPKPSPEPEPAPAAVPAPEPRTPYAPILPPATWPDAMAVALVSYDALKD